MLLFSIRNIWLWLCSQQNRLPNNKLYSPLMTCTHKHRSSVWLVWNVCGFVYFPIKSKDLNGPLPSSVIMPIYIMPVYACVCVCVCARVHSILAQFSCHTDTLICCMWMFCTQLLLLFMFCWRFSLIRLHLFSIDSSCFYFFSFLSFRLSRCFSSAYNTYLLNTSLSILVATRSYIPIIIVYVHRLAVHRLNV